MSIKKNIKPILGNKRKFKDIDMEDMIDQHLAPIKDLLEKILSAMCLRDPLIRSFIRAISDEELSSYIL